jgi:hypothetical protein
MTKHEKHIAALTRAAKKQPDPVKRARIVEKIREVKSKKAVANWLGS